MFYDYRTRHHVNTWNHYDSDMLPKQASRLPSTIESPDRRLVDLDPTHILFACELCDGNQQVFVQSHFLGQRVAEQIGRHFCSPPAPSFC